MIKERTAGSREQQREAAAHEPTTEDLRGRGGAQTLRAPRIQKHGVHMAVSIKWGSLLWVPL